MEHPPVNSWGPNGDATNGQPDGGISSSFSKMSMNSGMPPQPQQPMKIPQNMMSPASMGMPMQQQQQQVFPGHGQNHVMPPNSQHQGMPPHAGMNHSMPLASPPMGPGGGAHPGMNHSAPTTGVPTPTPTPPPGLNHIMPPVSATGVGSMGVPAGINQGGMPPTSQAMAPPSGALNHTMPPVSQPVGAGMNHTMPPTSQPLGGAGINHALPPPSSTPSQTSMVPPAVNFNSQSQNNLPGAPSVNHTLPPQQLQQPGGINAATPQHQQSAFARPPGAPGMNHSGIPSQPSQQPGMVPPTYNQPSGPGLGINHGMPPQPGQHPSEIPSQPLYGRPPGPPGPGGQQTNIVQNHVQPGGMQPMTNSLGGAPGQPSLPRQRYPAYPQQQQPSMGAPMPPATQTYPSYPQPQQQHQQPQFQQPGMPLQQPQPGGGYYPGPGGAPHAGPQYPRAPGPQGGMPQQNYPQMGPVSPEYGQGAPQYAQPSQQQGQKRLDPDQMPSAIGVMQEDQQTRGGMFRTDQKGLLPPLVTTKFQVEDFGNSSPRFVRSTMYSVPAQPDMLKQTAIPFALVINPFESPAKDEQPIPCVDLGPMGPVRCIRCKAYMSPLMQFIDGGRRFQCMLCKATTEVPPEYFQHLDHTGQRVDKWERPELWKGTYEYIATAEYCRNNVLPKEPAFIFVIDVSYNNVKSGLVNLLCSQMKNLIETLPSHTPVGFITYNSKVHFYNIDPSLGQPQMVIVPDVADMFMPLLRGFLVPCAEAMNSVDLLMEQIPALFGDTKETEAVLGPAIVAGMEALKASDRVGKLLLFHSSLPTSDAAPGKLKNREADRKLLGTDKEKTVLVPQATYYNQLGQDCVGAGVSVDLYLFNNSYVDVATIGQVARLTGGSVSKYTYFQADIDGPRVIGDLILHLGRPVGFDGVMRVRTSTGVRPTDFFGHYYMANTTDVELAAVDSQKGLAVEIKHDASITDEDGVYIQIALLYTTIYGQRRLRVHNLALNTCMQMADLYRNCELDTIINFMAKQSISRSVDTTPQDLREGVIKRCAQMLATYRKHCANPSMPGQLILPECLKLLPLYINCVLRSDAVAGTSEITPDDRSWLMYTTMTMGVPNTVHYFYPKLIPVAGPKGSVEDPMPVRCSRDKLSEDSAFVLENGIYIFMWIGVAVNPDWLQNIFGVSNLGQINVETITELPDHVNSDDSLRLRALIRSLRTERQRHMRLTIVRQRDKMELVMNRFLVEDRGTDGQASYVDFLCHMHKEIRSLLNQ